MRYTLFSTSPETDGCNPVDEMIIGVRHMFSPSYLGICVDVNPRTHVDFHSVSVLTCFIHTFYLELTWFVAIPITFLFTIQESGTTLTKTPQLRLLLKAPHGPIPRPCPYLSWLPSLDPSPPPPDSGKMLLLSHAKKLPFMT